MANPKPQTRPATSSASGDEVNAALLTAAYNGDAAGVKTALEKGADINVKHPATGLTALHIAVGTNNLPLTRYLIEQHDPAFGPDAFGRWPTVIAAECQVSAELADYIVEKEAAAVESMP